MENDEKVKNGNNETGESPFLLLNDTQWRYITAMTENPSFSKKQAADHIGISERTVYNWAQTEPHVEEALALARQNIHAAALEMRKQVLLAALRVKIALLNSEDENVRSKAATEIIEWELGKAPQQLKHSDMNGDSVKQDITVKIEYVDGNPKTN